MTDDVKNLVNKYNKTTDSIKSQTLSVEKLKQKIDNVVKDNRTPASLKNIEKQIDTDIKEADKLKKEIDTLNFEQDGRQSLMNKNTSILNSDTSPGVKNTLSAKNESLSKEYSSTEAYLDKIRKQYDEINVRISDSKSKLEDEKETLKSLELNNLNTQLEIANSKLNQSKLEANSLKEKIVEVTNKNNIPTFGKGFDELSTKIDKFKTKISRLITTVAVFSLIRNGLTSLRNNFTSLLKSNDEFSGSLNQIKANLMTAFAPIYNACLPAINALMNALSKITGTIAVFVANLFGTSLENAKNQAKGLSKQLNNVSKSGKKASGSLASFDTLEVLQDTSSSSTPTGSGGAGTIDYSGDIEYSEKLLNVLNKVADVLGVVFSWLWKNKELVLEIGGIVALAFVASKIIKFAQSFQPLISILGKVKGLFIKTGKDGEKSFNNIGTGVTIALSGLLLMIKNVSSLIENWDDLDTKQKLIKIGFAALGAAAIALGYAIAAGISAATLGIGALIALIATAVTAVIAFIAKLATEKDGIKSVEDATNSLREAQENHKAAMDSYVSAVDKSEEAFKKLEEAEKRTGLSGASLFNQVQNGTLDYKNMTAAQKEVYKAYLENNTAQQELEESTKSLSEAKKAETIASFENQLAIAAETGNYDDYKKSVIAAYEEGSISADEARDLLEKSMSRMSNATQQTFMEDIPSDIKEGMEPDKYKTTWNKFKEGFGDMCDKIGDFFKKTFTETIPNKLNELKEKLTTFFKQTLPNLAITGVESLVNAIITAFESLINAPIKAVNKIIDTANDIPGVDLDKFSKVKLNRVQIPRLAKGAAIPPNHMFNAILGDQKHGMNLETPVSLMGDVFDDRLNKFFSKMERFTSQVKEIILKNMTFIIQMGTTDFKKIVIEAIRLTEQEIGRPLLLN